MPFVRGYLIVHQGRPDNSLPGDQPGIDNSLPGGGIEGPVDPGFGIPLPPVIDNGLPGGPPPTYPIPPPMIDNSLPRPPTMWPRPPFPPTTWPPPQPIRPEVPIYPTYPAPPPHVGGGPSTPPGGVATPPIAPGGERPSTQPVPPPPGGIAGHPLPMPPGAVWPPLPPEVSGPVMCLVWIVGAGYRWTVIDPSLEVGMPLPGGPPGGRVDNTLPPVATPRRG